MPCENLRLKMILFAFLAMICTSAFGDTADITIPDKYIALIKTTDFVEVTGTNDLGGKEDFNIHNVKAIGQFVKFLTSDIYTAAAKDLKPQFKSMSVYKVRLSAQGKPVLEFQVIGDSVIDIPGDTSYYMESDRHSDNIMAPLLRLR